MYRKQVRRRRAVLIGLVLIGFVLLTATFSRGPGGAGGLFGTVFDPIQTVADRALKPPRDLLNWFDETMAARGERDRLAKELAELRGQAIAGKVAVEENRQLRGMVKLARAGITEGYEPVTATVTARSPTVWYSTVTVDRGSGDGVKVNDPVINGDGLVGRVSSVGHGGAVVTLISDGSSAVSAKIVPGGAQGVVRPKVGSPERLVIEFLDRTRYVGKGQTVVTSGWRSSDLSSLFPRGIPIGEVDRAPIDEREAIQTVELRGFANLKDLDLVQILTGGDRG